MNSSPTSRLRRRYSRLEGQRSLTSDKTVHAAYYAQSSRSRSFREGCRDEHREYGRVARDSSYEVVGDSFKARRPLRVHRAPDHGRVPLGFFSQNEYIFFLSIIGIQVGAMFLITYLLLDMVADIIRSQKLILDRLESMGTTQR